jgi:hypothetical protein
MSIDKELQKRSNALCELCASEDANIAHLIPHSSNNKIESH